MTISGSQSAYNALSLYGNNESLFERVTQGDQSAVAELRQRAVSGGKDAQDAQEILANLILQTEQFKALNNTELSNQKADLSAVLYENYQKSDASGKENIESFLSGALQSSASGQSLVSVDWRTSLPALMHDLKNNSYANIPMRLGELRKGFEDKFDSVSQSTARMGDVLNVLNDLQNNPFNSRFIFHSELLGALKNTAEGVDRVKISDIQVTALDYVGALNAVKAEMLGLSAGEVLLVPVIKDQNHFTLLALAKDPKNPEKFAGYYMDTLHEIDEKLLGDLMFEQLGVASYFARMEGIQVLNGCGAHVFTVVEQFIKAIGSDTENRDLFKLLNDTADKHFDAFKHAESETAKHDMELNMRKVTLINYMERAMSGKPIYDIG